MCAALVERIAAGAKTKPLLWLDHFGYSARVLAGGSIPWLDAAEFLAYYCKAHRLLRPGVAPLPLEGFFDAWLTAHPSLVAGMAGKRRVGFALKTLLSAEGPRSLLSEIAAAARDSLASTPLVITAPSPRRLIAWAHARANDVADLAEVEVSGDDVESASMYVADFLRTFAESRVDALLLEETSGRGPRSAEEVGRYQPVINVARHYRWDVGLKVPDSAFAPGTEQGIDFCIANARWGGVGSVILDEAFWAGEPAPPVPGTGFYFARVPEDAAPEDVLARLATLW